MSKRDFYEVLGVSKNADAKEIKRAYRKLASTTQTATLMTQKPKTSLKKRRWRTKC